MNDLQTLIHTNAKLAYDQGGKAERERIIKLIEAQINAYGKDSWLDVIALIRGEQK